MGAGDARRSSLSAAPVDFLLRSLKATVRRAPMMIAPPTPTTTPMITFLFPAEMPEPLPLLFDPGTLPLDPAVVWVSTMVRISLEVSVDRETMLLIVRVTTATFVCVE